MTTKSDWEALPPDMTAGQRRKPGEPPTTDEMLAHSRGELSAADAQRVQQWLDANPDEALALTQPFPEDDARPGDPGYLAEEEVSRRWVALRKELRPEARVPRSPLWIALAAAAAVVFAGLYAYEVRQARAPSTFTVDQELSPAGRERGRRGGPKTLDVTQRQNDIALKLTKAVPGAWYRIEIWPAADDRDTPVWKSEPTQPHNDRLEMTLYKTSLRPGIYWIKALRLDAGAKPELAGEYLVRVP